MKKNLTVGRLAREYGLSRSTLLYYDRVGLLHPQGRAPGEYREYGPDQVSRLERVLTLRRAGMGLAEIKTVLDGPESRLKTALEQRLKELDAEAATLRGQQEMVARLLGSPQATMPDPGGSQYLNKDTWTKLLESSGFTEDDMLRWHAAFERNSPDNHQKFLEFLRIPAEEIKLIRAWSTDSRRLLAIRKMSERFMDLLFELFEPMPRQGPGDRANTLRALAAVPCLPENPTILDVGCGNGAAALELARATRDTGGKIWALDFHQPFLDTLAQKAAAQNLSSVVRPVCGDMAKLAESGFKPDQFDLIWSEGAAYIMGFDNALTHWSEFLKPGGCIVISEMSWFVDPAEGKNLRGEDLSDAQKFWEESYPGMRGEKENEQAAEQLGFKPLLRFRLPHQVWWDEFYIPLAAVLDDMEKKYTNDPEALAFLATNRQEIDLHRKHGDAYGYAFYVLQKP